MTNPRLGIPCDEHEYLSVCCGCGEILETGLCVGCQDHTTFECLCGAVSEHGKEEVYED